jgi:hypothetical protein
MRRILDWGGFQVPPFPETRPGFIRGSAGLSPWPPSVPTHSAADTQRSMSLGAPKRGSSLLTGRRLEGMFALLTILAVTALVGWVADQTLRDLQGIRRT